MSQAPDFNESCAHLANIIRQAEADRDALAGARAMLSHCVVELMLRDAKGFAFPEWRERDRARLFGLWDAGKIRLSIGGGKVSVEIIP